MRIVRMLVAGMLVCTTGIALAETYVVYVKRIDKDLYRTSEGVYIETRYCYHYSYGEEAILRYEPYSYSNKIIFDDGTTCDVAKILK